MTRLFEAKPFIIAEVGSNWHTLSHCLESISLAKQVGADAVKFQAFNHHALYGSGDGQTEPATPMHHVLPLDWLPLLKEKADACGIEFMCTAFSPELVAQVDAYVSVHKVASSDLSYPQLLEAVARTGKPVLLSTGASSRTDIERALECIDPSRLIPENLVLLYCVASYPAKTIDLRVLHLMNQWWPGQVGFSDHSTDIVGHPVMAAEMGAVVLEKHFTAFPDLDTPDRPHSLTSDEFKTMVDYIRGRRQPVIGPTPEEKDMVLRHNRRLIATRDIAPGEALQYGHNYGAYRSLQDDTRGLSPFAWRSLEGKAAKVALKRGHGIGLGDF